ncbi:cobyrinate a,c-diamide synthase [Thermincola potens]|uniref:Cobyrinate a,c-diamide synthase n=1 Tax=Thermincola potens (strain JR) TaxID=635013 RepID=D5XEU8_THEPJ|nr:cobyrinate a,c-diamide synthase [Thermincola potens]ADG82169.1 cobyrinic acid a,c-diamide synthase [Thermincola potens JR]
MKAPRILIAGTHSGSGKTTITTAIMGLLKKKGYKVNPFKVGPDYIDPSYHAVATGNPGRNLDCWMLSQDKVYELFCRTAQQGGINVIEGVMGLFDGASGIDDAGSSAQIAKLTNTPVLLVVDVRSTARSAAAVVLGFQKFDPALNIAGVILNRVGSDRHLGLVSEAIEKYCRIPIVGAIRKNELLELPSRHLGLIPTGEGRQLPEKIDCLVGIIEQDIDLEKLLAVAGSAPELQLPEKPRLFPEISGKTRVRLGIARDEAFSFYYQDSLDILSHLGAELIPFSPMRDERLPADLHGLYIGGGYPEIYLEELADNKNMLKEIKEFGLSGKPVYAECGGFMYLSDGITTAEGVHYPLVGLVPGISVMKPKLVSLGYVTAYCAADNLLGPAGTTLKGHEFHYSELDCEKHMEKPAYRVIRNRSGEQVLSGYADGNILASYIHVHFATNTEAAKSFLEKCRLAGGNSV